MRNLIARTLMIVALSMALIVPVSYADMTTMASYDIWGQVTTSAGTPIQGVTVLCRNCYPTLQDISDSGGWYHLPYHNFCDVKTVEAYGEGWEENRRSISDGTCPDCCVEGDEICEMNAVCGSGRRLNFTMYPDNNQDIDSDGLVNALDNCPHDPNWLNMGTCTSGKRGSPCTTHKSCGCGGYCSKLQEDCDGNGIGDACDTCVQTSPGCSNCNNTAMSEVSPAHKLMEGKYIRNLSDEDTQVFWFMIFNLWWTGHNYTAYPSTLQGLVGAFNGPDKLCGECVHDFNENGICDEEEEGGLSLLITPRQYLEALQDAYQYCLNEKIPNCDPEEDPFGCMW